MSSHLWDEGHTICIGKAARDQAITWLAIRYLREPSSNHNLNTALTATMAPGVWTKETEADLLMAIRIAENGYKPVTRETWFKATEVMRMMGYQTFTWTSISQKWSKDIQKKFQAKYPLAVQVAEGTVTLASASAGVAGPSATTAAVASSSTAGSGAATATPRAKRGRPQKRAREEEKEEEEEEEEELEVQEEEDEEDDSDEAPVEKAPAKKAPVAKKQRKQRKGKGKAKKN
ncbi:hypothetical protein F4803DRAFT_574167 [Xylaria telfairii]|nr:hypothetical protein F4803DRAFT_574167 [Xylaria telfairii]